MSESIRVICAAECGSEWSGRKMSSQAAGTGGTVPILGAQHKCRLGEAWDILLHLAGRSLAAFGHAAGSVTDQPMTRSVSDEEFNAGQRGESSANLNLSTDLQPSENLRCPNRARCQRKARRP